MRRDDLTVDVLYPGSQPPRKVGIERKVLTSLGHEHNEAACSACKADDARITGFALSFRVCGERGCDWYGAICRGLLY